MKEVGESHGLESIEVHACPLAMCKEADPMNWKCTMNAGHYPSRPIYSIMREQEIMKVEGTTPTAKLKTIQ